jgi:L-alanine-DL-glutamate epimerase-like enolase superfamily enzyme
VDSDAAHLDAARSGIGADGILLVDAGTVWVDDVNAAAARLQALKDTKAHWLEEPFVSGALNEYQKLAGFSGKVGLAGGEGAHNFHMARHMIDHAGLKFVQIDAGRMGISEARRVALYARSCRVQYVNHTFNSHIALSASLQPFADDARSNLAEFPVEAKAVAREVTRTTISRDEDGTIKAPDAPGLGLEIDPSAFNKYLQDIDIRIAGRTVYRSPGVPEY